MPFANFTPVSTTSFSPFGLISQTLLGRFVTAKRFCRRGAIELAKITTEDPYAGMPEPSDLGALTGDLALYDGAIGRMETEYKIEQAKRTE